VIEEQIRNGGVSLLCSSTIGDPALCPLSPCATLPRAFRASADRSASATLRAHLLGSPSSPKAASASRSLFGRDNASAVRPLQVAHHAALWGGPWTGAMRTVNDRQGRRRA
jgi:hypothetical protein